MTISGILHRVPGSSLLITVILSLVIGLICGLLILQAWYNLHLRTDLHVDEKLGRNMNSCINMVLEDDPSTGPAIRKTSDLFGQGNDSAYIQEESWGIYAVASVEVRDGARTRQKSFFFGSLLPASLDGCLYLAEHRRSLSVVGSTMLTGKAYLPKGGVKPGYIDQRGYDHTILVDGSIERSMDSLPALETGVLSYYAKLPGADTSGKTGDNIPAILEQSFHDSLRIIWHRGAMVLSGCNLHGHILLVSDSLIDVNADARLDNVLLAAPVIRIRSGFSGRLQAYGLDSVVAEDNCRFDYPSALVVVKRSGDTGQPRLVIGKNDLLEGVALSWCADGDQNKTLVEVGAGSIIRGVLYASGYLSLRGNVSGATVTDYFIYRTPAVIYENYLADAQLNRNSLAAWYAGPVIFNGRKKNRVLQWVN
jgi:hypothetical protein